MAETDAEQFTCDDAELIVETFTEGLGARAAYDVTVATKSVRLAAEVRRNAPAESTCRVEIPVDSFEAHALHRTKSRKPADLSSSDASTIRGKSQDKLRSTFGPKVIVEASSGTDIGGGRHRFSAKTNGATFSVEVESTLSDDGLELTATAKPRLSALGVAKVKGPLGVITVADEIQLRLTAKLSRHS